jgi:limonene-1,2-epoxide hydrolase
MNENAAATPERIRAALEQLGEDLEGGNAALAAMYAPHVVFQDPIQKLAGREEFLAMNRRLRGRAKRLRFTVTRAVQAEDLIVLAWKFDFEPKLGPTMQAEGSTLLRLEGGQVVHHRDYFDLLGFMIDAVPGVSHLYRAVLARFG